jgi:hypothetical protein
MSMSTQHGGNRKPSATKATAGGKPNQGPATDPPTTKAAAGKPAAQADPASKPAAKAAGARPAAKPGQRPTAKGGGRRPVTPVKVHQGRSWGPIALFTAVALIAIGIVGYGGFAVYQNGLTWSERAAKIDGLVNWRKKDAKVLEYTEHKYGVIDFSKMPMNPAVGGPHNPNWQRCLGDVYDAPIATEHAIHSMEHGAVWITYKTSLPKNEVDSLAKRVKGNDFTLMSPYDAQDTPISLQTWGYQLKVSNASDPRIDAFLKALRQVSSREPGATCSSDSMITETGTIPHDLGKDAPQDPAGQPAPAGK